MIMYNNSQTENLNIVSATQPLYNNNILIRSTKKGDLQYNINRNRELKQREEEKEINFSSLTSLPLFTGYAGCFFLGFAVHIFGSMWELKRWLRKAHDFCHMNQVSLCILLEHTGDDLNHVIEVLLLWRECIWSFSGGSLPRLDPAWAWILQKFSPPWQRSRYWCEKGFQRERVIPSRCYVQRKSYPQQQVEKS